MNNSSFNDLVIGALFHDIGKFWQRTNDREVKKQIEKEYQWFMGSRNYAAHQEWSAYFLDKILKEGGAGTIALKHHNPESNLEYMVAVADKLSAAEREDWGTGEKLGRVSEEPLVAILSRIQNVRKVSDAPLEAYKPLLPVEYENWENNFPVFSKDEAIKGGYLSLWSNFVSQIQKVVSRKGEKRLLSFYHLLHRFTGAIPSAAYYQRPTVSLFDHLRTTCALACCIYGQGIAKDELEKVNRTLLDKFRGRPFSEETLKKKVFCLLKGDISGIQDFVYDITSKGAAKGLKGRSFYLAMLAEVVAEWLLREEELPLTNLLFSGGGHFYLLLPEKFLGRLEERRKQLNSLLWEAHDGKLSLILSAVPLTYADFDRERFADRWQEVELNSREDKLRKLDVLFADHYDQIFSPRWEGEQVCTVCQRAVNAGEEKCSFCAGFEEWGEALIKQPYLVKRWEKEKPFTCQDGIDHPAEVFKALSCEVFFSGGPVNDGLTYAVNKMDFLLIGADAWIFLPNHTPFFGKDTILDFDHMAQNASGKNLWGVLRGDVDNLGDVFGRGLGDDRSISRVAGLSREIAWFFSAALNKLCSKFGNSIYLIYSGGDDFFIVGGWDILPSLAVEINESFQKFAAHNPHLTLSCGIFVAPAPKYPLSKAAQQAGVELEEKAKGYSTSGTMEEKNAVAFLGKAFSWKEFKAISETKDLLKTLIETKGFPRALFPVIYSAYADWHRYQKGEYPLHRVWRLHYNLHRIGSRHEKARGELYRLEESIITQHFMLNEGGLYAARWAELLLGKGEMKKDATTV